MSSINVIYFSILLDIDIYAELKRRPAIFRSSERQRSVLCCSMDKRQRSLCTLYASRGLP